MANSFINIYQEKCSCTDCQSGISPLAYLAELLQYGINHIKADGASVDNSFFDNTFFQPFQLYPFNCDDLNTIVCEVRTVNEVLQRYVGSLTLNPAVEAEMVAGIQNYCLEIYEDILQRFNTSYKQIRLIQSAGLQTKTDLAKALGLPLPVFGQLDVFAKLFLNNSDMANFNETAIEELFGVAASNKPIFSTGAKSGDTNSYVTDWNFKGIIWNVNTDLDGWVYLKVSEDSGVVTVYAYNNSNMLTTNIAASGTLTSGISSTSGSIILNETNTSGLTGVIILNSFPNSTTETAIKFSLIPEYLSWQLTSLTDNWLSIDNSSRTLPIIDPDIVTGSDVYAIQPDWAFPAAALWSSRKGDLTTDRATIVSSQTSALIGSVIESTFNPQGISYNRNTGNLYYSDPDHAQFWKKIPTGSTFSFSLTAGVPCGIFSSVEDGHDILYIASAGDNTIRKWNNYTNSEIWSFGSFGTDIGQFDNPFSICSDNEGNVYVADTNNNRIQKLTVGTQTTLDSGSTPSQIFVDSTGFVYIAETGKNRVSKYKPNGSLDWRLGNVDGSSGTGIAQFDAPVGIAVDSDGFVYISDTNNDRIQKFSSDGLYVTLWSVDETGPITNAPGAAVIGKFGTPATECLFVIVNSSNSHHNGVRVFSLEGALLQSYNTYSSTPDYFTQPKGISVDSDGNLYVADSAGSGVIAYLDLSSTSPTWVTHSVSGFNHIKAIFANLANVYVLTYDGTISEVKRFNLLFSSSLFWGKTNNPLVNIIQGNGLFVTDTGLVYVTDPGASPNDGYINYKFAYAIGSAGSGPGQFNNPYDVKVDIFNNFYVADKTNNRLQYFDSDGNYLSSLGGGSSTLFNAPVGISIDLSGNLYVSENASSSKLKKISPDGTVLKFWDSVNIGGTSTSLGVPAQTALDENGNIYLADTSGSDKIFEFDIINGLGAALKTAWGKTYSDMLNLLNAASNGKNISADIDGMGLTPDRFNYLSTLLLYTGGGAILPDAEMDAFFDILLYGWKVLKYYRSTVPTVNWRQVEITAGISLSPQFFMVLTDDEESQLSFDTWSATILERKAWKDFLKSRSDDKKLLQTQFYENIANAEENDLQLLRNVLIRASDNDPARVHSLQHIARHLNERLFIDCENNCCQKTTRIEQAVEVLQNILFSIRNGLTLVTSPVLSLNADHFDDEWLWLGTYESWRAAMFVFFYPENLLNPNYRTIQTPAFRDILNTINSSATIDLGIADQVLVQYSNYLGDVSQMKVQAACNASTLIYNPDNSSSPEIAALEKVLSFVFGVGGFTNSLYMCTFDDQRPDGYVQSFWFKVPNINVSMIDILGSQVFESNPSRRFLHILFTYHNDGQKKIGMTRFNLLTGIWDNDLTEIKAPEVMDVGGNFSLSLSQKYRNRGRLLLNLSFINPSTNSYNFYVNMINYSGSDFEQDGWNNFGHFKQLQGQPQPSILSTFDLQNGKFLNIMRYDGVSTTINADIGDLGNHSFLSKIIYIPGLNMNSVSFAGGFHKTIPSDPLNSTTIIYLFWKDSSENLIPTSLTVFAGGTGVSPLIVYSNAKQSGIDNLIKAYQDIPEDSSQEKYPVYYSQESKTNLTNNLQKTASVGIFDRTKLSSTNLPLFSAKTTISPSTFGLTRVTPGQINPDLYKTAKLESAIYQLAQDLKASVSIYLDEGFYFLPMLLAEKLQQAHYFTEALDMYRCVYNYYPKANNRKIWPYLQFEENIDTGSGLTKSGSWLQDPIDPHAIAKTRNNAYTRFTVYSIVTCLNAFGDSEFSADTPESIVLSRSLYQTASDLITDIQLGTGDATCTTNYYLLDQYDADFVPDFTATWFRVKSEFNNISSTADQTSVLTAISSILGGTDTLEIKLAKISETIDNEVLSEVYSRETMTGLLNTFTQEAALKVAYSSAAVSLAPPDALKYQVQLENTILQLSSDVQNIHLSNITDNLGLTEAYTVEPSSLLPFLRTAIASPTPSVQLGLNIYDTTGVTATFQPGFIFDASFEKNIKNDLSVSTQVTLNAPANITELSVPDWKNIAYCTSIVNINFCVAPNPIPVFLQLQAEANLYKINNCMNIAGMTRELQVYATATDNYTGIPVFGKLPASPGSLKGAFPPGQYHFDFLLEKAKQFTSVAQQMEASMLSALEKFDNESYSLMKAFQDINLSRENIKLQDLQYRESAKEVDLATLQLQKALFIEQHFTNLLASGLSSLEISALVAQGVATIFYTAAAISSAIGDFALFNPFLNKKDSFFSLSGQAASSIASTLSQLASFDRRTQEWQFDEQTAGFDVSLANTGIDIANDKLAVSGQQVTIAQLQASNAADTLNFLKNKFTNAQLYQWMSNVILGIYNFFLNQATATAIAAMNQLAFERQEQPDNIIKSNYWSTTPLSQSQNSPDRKGLTGAEQLQADLALLEQTALQTDQRKLQITKNISLATLDPYGFQVFRETGILNFSTTMELFDIDFPGHYMRLIKDVKLNVIALVPPGQGIKATLSCNGTSLVTVNKDGNFVTIPAPYTRPDKVALSGAIDATGVFNLQPMSNMLNPFEGIGVATTWTLEMQQAANRFDYTTIADVILTLDYTALENDVYRQKVARNLSTDYNAARVYSFSNQFSDTWYDLSNQPDPTIPFTFNLTTVDADFPAYLSSLQITKVLIAMVPAANETPALSDINNLKYQSKDDSTPTDCGMLPFSGNAIVSSGTGGVTLQKLYGKNPAGDWTIKLDNTTDFNNGTLSDFYLIIYYSGTLPEWNL